MCKAGNLDPSQIIIDKELLPRRYVSLAHQSMKIFENPGIDTLHVVKHIWRLSKLDEVAWQRRRLLYFAKSVPGGGQLWPLYRYLKHAVVPSISELAGSDSSLIRCHQRIHWR